MRSCYNNDYYLKTVEHDYYKLHINFELKTIKSGTTINLKELLYALKTAKGLGQKEIAVCNICSVIHVDIDKLINYLSNKHFNDCKIGVINFDDENRILKFYKEKESLTSFVLEV